ncbi:MAG: hypothetical protein IPP78_10880 [Holophagaceae bacterium]|nr:hypothetical protein [Holophagaceae bacterium]
MIQGQAIHQLLPFCKLLDLGSEKGFGVPSGFFLFIPPTGCIGQHEQCDRQCGEHENSTTSGSDRAGT